MKEGEQKKKKKNVLQVRYEPRVSSLTLYSIDTHFENIAEKEDCS